MSEFKKKGEDVAAETYGGILGGVLPLIVMIVVMIALAANGMRSTQNFWSAGFAAVVVGFLVYKDKSRFQKALLDGAKDNIFAFLIASLLLTGVLSKILSASHLVNAMLWAASQVHLAPSMMPLLVFLLGVVLSSATGSAAATVTTVTPVMLPVAAAMGCDVNVVCGAIMSGACFGDNIAPISDTTIASSSTQEVSVIKVVKSRLKYSLVAGLAAAIAFIIVGISTTNPAAAAAAAADAKYASSLVFLIIPVIVVVLMLNKANFFTSVIIAEFLGVAMLLAFGFLNPTTLVAKDGLIASGISGMVNSIIFLLFIFFVVSLIREAGVLEAFLKSMRKFAKSDLTAEIAAGGMVSIMSIAISSGTSAITFCGPIIRGLLRPFKIDRARAANFLDGLGCGVGYLVPTNAGCMVLASLAVASGVVKEGYNPINFVVFNFHSMALVIVFWFAILSGWGRKHETDEELAADGIVVEEAS